MVKQPTVVSTFAGCGGSSLGYRWAGFTELLALDNDGDSVKVFTANFPEVSVLQADICQVSVPDILKATGLKPGELDVLDGSPPCQGFSHAGRRKVRDTRNDLFKEFVRLVRGLEPRVFVMENVAGMASGRMKGRFIEIMKTLKALNYRVRCRKMNTKYYGVPQSRERLIFIGVRKDLGLEPAFPEPEKSIATVRKAFAGLPPQVEDRPMPDWLRQAAKHIKAGMNFKHIANVFLKAKDSPAGCIATRRQYWDRPASTITKSEFGSGLLHPEEDRFLTLAELKRLSTFPDDFKFTDRRLGCERIGNAVMPRFMYHIARTIRVEILDKASLPNIRGIGAIPRHRCLVQKVAELGQNGARTRLVARSPGGPCKGKGRAGKGPK